jgi:predicted AAA+ superfamily ATPase
LDIQPKMKRIVDQALKKWKESTHRKPLIIRGARQVGKTTAVRNLGKCFAHFVEINFEESMKWKAIFDNPLDPIHLIRDLELVVEQKIIPGQTLLFFDEVQACPQAIIALRYFYERLPALHLIAAGSLLEFTIDEIGIPVGRVQFLYMYPMSFVEFLWAQEKQSLVDAIITTSTDAPFSTVVHDKINRLVGEYLAIGGMPEAVLHWTQTHDYTGCLEIHHDLLTAFKQDFHKYARSTQIKYVEHLFRTASIQAGQVFRYTHIPGEFRKRELEPALALLIKANMVSPVFHSAAQGISLGAQAHLDKFKLILLDVALMQVMLGLTSSDWILDPERVFINRGVIAEAFVGQELLAYGSARQAQHLYYWHRNQPTSQAEVDYVIVKNQQIIPIEVKAGKGSTLRSMHAFLQEHPQSPYGIRFSTQNYSVYEKIHSLPLYAVVNSVDASLIYSGQP